MVDCFNNRIHFPFALLPTNNSIVEMTGSGITNNMAKQKIVPITNRRTYKRQVVLG